ncbi:hypothetical protein [Streptomyces olivoreticuli]|uniref:hypothetical protein n=1 Tax=Streptomyces olivoreticuli TaxID=68246 RepID=UPI000E229345|nr:hypothetical protein [Streptomyces olivoreticuli]
MSARHAHAAHSPRSSDPLGLVLGWLWALGTLVGFVCLGAIVGNGLGDRGDTGPALAVPDSAPPAV